MAEGRRIAEGVVVFVGLILRRRRSRRLEGWADLVLRDALLRNAPQDEVGIILFTKSPFLILRVGVSGISETISSRSGHLVLPISCCVSQARMSSSVSVGIRFQHREAAGALAHHRIGDRRDRALQDGRVTIDQRLDIGRIELHPAAIDDFLQPPGDADIAVRIHAREIAGAKPAVRRERARGRLVVVEIAAEHRAAAHLQFALLVRGRRRVVQHHAKLGAGAGAAGTGHARVERIARTVIGAGLQFAHAPELRHLAVRHHRLHRLRQFGRTGAAGNLQKAQRRQPLRIEQVRLADTQSCARAR